ncbi:N-carbamoylsarcosine amidase [Pseudonocardia sulfidoxydans NBRC 16205]|uniref:N-carbamoylsarcosine amidase n=1 Tax=Pseudonocardia sulfidoxydans NBRC 16205 TaxID=1223511 RepID=A0A511DCY5_9PSEU|nr:isochorismatase family protein [Pseudonocardia sulfidoxydans]GEL22417.1 N-carbamoylsarcosine amidase [Pseudonocardia sulfidoxydans NBRC 16205]
MTETDDKPHGSKFSGRVGWGRRPALVVVDLVHAYVDADSPFALPGINSAIEATEALTNVARQSGLSVIWTDVVYHDDMSNAGLFYKKVPGLSVYAANAPGRAGQLVLKPEAEDLRVTKQYASAFFGTSLASTLHAAEVDTVVICGVSTSGCIRATATDALNHGFRPQVVRDACADRNAELHESNLRDLDAKYADVCSLGEAVQHLSAVP